MPYVPYEGGGGPEADQKAENTLILFQKLQAAGVPCKMDNGQYARKVWGGDEKMIVLGNGRTRTYVSYDRWGFVADGNGGLMMEKNDDMVDQLGLDKTFQILLKYYGPKK